MKIYTSYFARQHLLPPAVVPISIALYPPKRYRGRRYTKLAPTPEILEKYKAGGAEAEYRIAYRKEVLARIDAKAFVNNLERFFGNLDVCFLCYEKPDAFCHRHLVAEWLRENGFNVEEWEPEDNKQLSFFNEIEAREGLAVQPEGG